MIFIHSLPFLAITINIILSRTVLIPGHCMYSGLVASSYSVFNFFGSKYRGHALYPFLPWTDYKSVVICIFLVNLGMVIYLMASFIICQCKKRPCDYENNEQKRDWFNLLITIMISTFRNNNGMRGFGVLGFWGLTVKN